MRYVFTILLFLGVNQIYGQLRKGDFVLGKHVNILYRGFGHHTLHNFSGGGEFYYSRMFYDRFMIGFSKSFSDFVAESNYDKWGQLIIKVPRAYFELSNQLKQYVVKDKWFVSIENTIGGYDIQPLITYNFEEERYESKNIDHSDKLGVRLLIGGGLNFPIQNNILFDSQIGISLFELGEYYPQKTSAFIHIQLKPLFSGNIKNQIDDLRRTLQDGGNYKLRGEVILKRNYNNEKYIINANPEIEYFIKNGLALISGISYDYRNYFKIGGLLKLKLGIEEYRFIGRNSMISFRLGLNGGYGEISSSENDFLNLRIPISLAVHYLKGRSRIYYRFTYEYEIYKRLNSNRSVDEDLLNSKLSHEYFLNQNLYIGSSLILRLYNSPEFKERELELYQERLNRFEFSVDFGFVFVKNK